MQLKHIRHTLLDKTFFTPLVYYTTFTRRPSTLRQTCLTRRSLNNFPLTNFCIKDSWTNIFWFSLFVHSVIFCLLLIYANITLGNVETFTAFAKHFQLFKRYTNKISDSCWARDYCLQISFCTSVVVNVNYVIVFTRFTLLFLKYFL